MEINLLNLALSYPIPEDGMAIDGVLLKTHIDNLTRVLLPLQTTRAWAGANVLPVERLATFGVGKKWPGAQVA